MQRRAFLRSSAVSIGTFAQICATGWTLEGSGGPQTVQTGQASASGPLLKNAEEQLAWGINSIVLKSPWDRPPKVDQLLTDTEHTVALNSFYRVGGEHRPATPTDLRITYDSDSLFVVFRCHEDNMSFLTASHEQDWYSLDGSPAGSETSTDVSSPPFPDEVDIFIQPDMGDPLYYHFAATLDGLTFGCERVWASNVDDGKGGNRSVSLSKVNAFEATVTRKTDEWLAFFQIPWKTVGGKPSSYFGLLPVRTRWRNGEFSSPVATDFVEQLPVDLFIETHFTGGSAEQGCQASLCQLSSGLLRWQRPAVVVHPGLETRHQISEMQSSLSAPTDINSLPQRLYLTQRWIDLLTLEGFSYRPRTGTIAQSDMTPSILRQEINAALREGAPELACQALDTYLRKLDQVSRAWFAESSPGDILNEEWRPVTKVDNLEVRDNTLSMRCQAGDRTVDLHLALPATGGIRLFSNVEGYFKPPDLLPLMATQFQSSCVLTTDDGKIVINRNPFSISFYNTVGRKVTEIGTNCLSFRFDAKGNVLATDFTNQLDATEAIYGFGERYDRFNQHGNVLTLWAMDEWITLGSGFRNVTYKCLPVFHSSKGYMVFDNSSYRVRADIGVTDRDKYRLTQHGPIFDYYFWIGSPEKALQSYTALTGRPILPPKWAFRPWIGRGEGAWLAGPSRNAVAEQESVVQQWETLGIPHSAIYSEGPSVDSPALNDFMRRRGIKVLGYFWPEVSSARQQSFLPKLKPNDLPILHCEDENATRELSYVDFTNPNARELVRQWWKRDLDLGVAGSMVDYGDLIPEGAVFHNGKSGAEMHNFYYHEYHRTISEVFSEKRGDDFILFARGAAPGTQKWVAQFAGDHPANFDGLKAVLTGALNLCACGFSTWGSDLGGYFGWPEPAVFMRWTQFSAFSPLMRPHGKAPRDPWYFGEAAESNYKFHAWLRENLLDYIYGSAVIAHQTGIPIMRSMAIAFPGEHKLAVVGDQYMFGPDLLVAPVIDESESRTIQFPSGRWTSLWDGSTVGTTQSRIALRREHEQRLHYRPSCYSTKWG